MPKKFDNLLKHLEEEGNVVSHTPPFSAALCAQLGIPAAWEAALTGPTKIKEQVRLLWTPISKQMPRTRDAYADNCQALVAVQTDEHPLSLLYCFDLGKIWMAQRGFPPSGPLPEFAKRFPVDLTPLYALHNGLVNFVADDDGPLPVDQWHLIPDPKKKGGVGLVEILMEGARSFGFDTAEDPVRAYYMDADDEEEPVEEVEDTWEFLDDWLADWLEE